MSFPITCTACHKTFTISDEIYEKKVAGRVVTIKCKSCSQGIRVDGTKGAGPGGAAATEPVATEPTAAPPAEPLWAVDYPDGQDREFTTAEVIAELERGVVNGATLVWRDGMSEWLEVAQVPELAGELKKIDAKKTAAAIAAARAVGPVHQPRAPMPTVTGLGGLPGATGGLKPKVTPAAAPEPARPAAPQPLASSVGTPLPKPRVQAALGADDVTPVPGRLQQPSSPELPKPPAVQPSASASASPSPSATGTPLPRPRAQAPSSAELLKPRAQQPSGSAAGTPLPKPRAQQPSSPELPKPRVQQPSSPELPKPRAQQPSSPELPKPRVQQPSSPELPKPRVQQPSSPELPKPRAPQPSSPEVPWTAAAAQPPTPPPIPQPAVMPPLPFATPPLAVAPPAAPLPPAAPAPTATPPLPASVAQVVARPPQTPPAFPLTASPVSALGTGPVLVADHASVEWPEAKSKAPLVVGVIAVVAIAAGAFVVFGGKEELPPPTPITASPPSPAATPTSTPTPTPTPTQTSGRTGAETATGSDPVTATQDPGATPGAGFAELFANGARKAESKGATLAPTSRFDAAATKVPLAQAAADAQACKQSGGPTGKVTVVVTFEPTGKVSSATITEAPFAGTATAVCISSALKRATVAPFSGLPGTVSKTFSIL